MGRLLQLYIAGTKQNDGKTTLALGLFNILKDSYPGLGYCKPVGQQFRIIDNKKIDKDVVLMNEIFQLEANIQDMSPVAVPKGFTEEFILNGDTQHLDENIVAAFERAKKNRDLIIIEGTGHAGVGAVFDLSNADVAQLIKSPVIIVAGGGIGRPIDEIMLNKALFDHRNVEVLGVIINKVLPEKYDKVNDLVRRGLKRKGIDVFGVIPHYPALSSPTIKQIVEDTKGTLLCGETELERVVGRILIGAMPPTTALDYLKGDVLLIAPGNREDLLITSMIGKALNVKEKYNVQGIVLTGDILPHPRVLELLKQSNIPVISVKEDTYEMARKINKMVVKIKPYDKEKIETVKSMTKEYVNTDLLLEKLITFAEKTA